MGITDLAVHDVPMDEFEQWVLFLVQKINQIKIGAKAENLDIENSPLNVLFSKDDGLDLEYLEKAILNKDAEVMPILLQLYDETKKEVIRRRILGG